MSRGFRTIAATRSERAFFAAEARSFCSSSKPRLSLKLNSHKAFPL